MMSKKRQNDVSEETVRKRMTFSKAMIRLGAYVTYCVIFLLKKLNKILCDAVKAFTSKTTAVILGVIRKFKKLGKKILVPFISCIKPVRKKFTVKRSETDMTVRSIRAAGAGQLLTKAVNYAVPVAAIVVFAAVLGNASKINDQISERASDAVIDNEVFTAASDNLELIEELTGNDYIFEQKTVEFEEPYERFRSAAGVDETGLIEAVGIYLDSNFLGTLANETELKETLSAKLEGVKSQPDVKNAEFRKKIEYRHGKYDLASLKDTDEILAYLNSGTEEAYYTVEEGDSLYLIAEEHGMTLDELLNMNPELEDPDLCVIGTQIRIACNLDNMPVVITKEITEETAVPFETQTVETESMFVGETELLAEGVNGEGTNTFEVCLEGDIEISRTLISTKVTKEPVPEMIAVGVKHCEVIALPDSEETVLSGTGQFMWPVNGGYISDGFISDRNHKGMDIAAPSGTEIYAAADGKVIAAGWNTGGYGYFVMIDHGNGYATLYGHMSKVIAENGADVKCGELIGEVGTTGNSTGNHLHFEVRYNNVCQNPANYICVNSASANIDLK